MVDYKDRAIKAIEARMSQYEAGAITLDQLHTSITNLIVNWASTI